MIAVDGKRRSGKPCLLNEFFKADKFSGKLASSSEGRIFRVETDEVLNLPGFGKWEAAYID